MKIRVATSQFPVSQDIDNNKKWIQKQIIQAANHQCEIIHFPECSLSGYAGVDLPDLKDYDWDQLLEASIEVLGTARENKIRVVLGSMHILEKHKPHNSSYIIDKNGYIIDRYDKRFCAGSQDPPTEDLLHFSPGNHFTTFNLNGIRCGLLICHDYRYPELYRAYKKQGVQLIFHSYHAAAMNPERKARMESQVGKDYFPFNPGTTLPEITMPATMISYAANNYLWISCSNSSAEESCWPAMMVRPDGVITGKLERNKPGLLISEIDTSIACYDSTKNWRERAIDGFYCSGKPVEDPRSKMRNTL